ncbi:DNA-directed RNA polymerase II core subunit [Ciborinia camelliae]|nr:DNA-directed RNA polymerase II core subunit [Ciborinia camelliae]
MVFTENRADLTSMSNAPERFELFILGDGEKKCTEEADTRTPNSSIFTFNKEDHTLGNLLRAHLLKDPHVIFSGYKIPHPLFSKFELRIQTDGEITPKEALVACCRNLVSELEVFSREFTKEFELRKMVSGDVAAADK